MTSKCGKKKRGTHNWGTAKYFTWQVFIPHFDVNGDFYCTDPQQHGICLAAFYDKNAKGC